MVVIGYVGPVRALDASFLGDSVYVALRPFDLGVAGPVAGADGLGPRGLRFLGRPWDYSPAWIRSAVEHATVEPWGEGWRIAGVLLETESAPPGEMMRVKITPTHPFGLELNGKGEPTRLRIGSSGAGGTLVTIRYGPTRSYRGGKLPRWIAWERGPVTLRLEIDEFARPKPGRLRHPPPAEAGWTMLSLEDPRGRALLRHFLGIGADEVEP